MMKILLTLSYLFFAIAGLLAQSSASLKLLGDFREGWEKDWVERKITKKPTKYKVVTEDTNRVLMAESHNTASALWRMLDIHPARFGKISWRWKVDKSLTHNKDERKKIGDDYAARLYVVFEPSLISWKTRAICYVWAGNEKVGSTFKNPYAKSVGMFVVRSGNKKAGKWVQEERNFVADYRQFFGEDPVMVTAVVLMVDTNNTVSKATAWFDDIVLEAGSVELEADEKAAKDLRIKF